MLPDMWHTESNPRSPVNSKCTSPVFMSLTELAEDASISLRTIRAVPMYIACPNGCEQVLLINLHRTSAGVDPPTAVIAPPVADWLIA